MQTLWKFRSFQAASNLNRAGRSQPSQAQAGVTRKRAMYPAKVLWPTLHLQLHDSASFRGWRQNLDLKSSSYRPFLKPTVTAYKYTCILISNLKFDTKIGNNTIIIIIITKTEGIIRDARQEWQIIVYWRSCVANIGEIWQRCFSSHAVATFNDVSDEIHCTWIPT